MSEADTTYTARFVGREEIELGRDNLLKCPTFLAGAAAAPTQAGSTVSIYDSSGTAVVSAAAVTVTSSVATRTITSATFDAVAEGLRVEWSLVMPDGVVHVFRRSCAVVRRRLYPVVTDADLLRRHTDLSALRPSTESSYQDYLDEAWAEITERIYRLGRRPYLILEPDALRLVHLFLTLSLVFRDFGGSGGGDGDSKWARLADHYTAQFEAAWTGMTFAYDADNDGKDGKGGKARVGMKPTLWLMGARNSWPL